MRLETQKIAWIAGALLVALLPVSNAFAQEDREGCKDHPMFTRMAGFYIQECEEDDFNQVEFVDENGEEILVEGKRHWTGYVLKDGMKKPTDLQIIRNFQNAIKKIGGVVVYEKIGDNYGETYLRLKKANQTVWVIVESSDGEKYALTIVEKSEMAQEIVADAARLAGDICSAGHAPVYGIYFDFDKSEIKPESDKAIEEIAKLLNENKNLKLYVVGHTDNAGSVDYNMRLSKERAEAVVQRLVNKYSISSGRLSAFGVGPLAPVTSNRSEEGRALNRRVELVEK